MEALRKTTEVLLGSVLISTKGGVPLHNLPREYQEVTLSPIPLEKLGFPSLELYLKSIPHCAKICRNDDGVVIVKGVANESNQHVAKLVSGQKKGKKRSAISKGPSRFSSSRGRGGFSRGKPLNIIRRSRGPFHGTQRSFQSRPDERTFGFSSDPPFSHRPRASAFNNTGWNDSRKANIPVHKSGVFGLPKTNGIMTPNSNRPSLVQSKPLRDSTCHVLTEVQNLITSTRTNNAKPETASSSYVVPPRMKRLREQKNATKESENIPNFRSNTNQQQNENKEDLRQIIEKQKRQSSASGSNELNARPTKNIFTTQNDKRNVITTNQSYNSQKLKENVITILKKYPQGLWGGVLLTFYKKDYGETPEHLLEIVKQDMNDRIDVKELVPGKSILYLKKEPEIKRTIVNELALQRCNPINSQVDKQDLNENLTRTIVNEHAPSTRNQKTADDIRAVTVKKAEKPKQPETATEEEKSKSSDKTQNEIEENDVVIKEQKIPILGETFAAYVCFVNSIDRFFVQRADSEIDELSAKLQEYFAGSNRKEDAVLKPKIGTGCCAYYNGQWYRAKVIMARHVEERSVYHAPHSTYRNSSSSVNEIHRVYKCTILYVDYGNMETVHSDKLRKLQPAFADLPAQAIQCKLCGITREGTQREWSNESNQCFQQLTDDQLLDVQVLTAWDNSIDVDLMTTDDENVAGELVTRGYAIPETRGRSALYSSQQKQQPETVAATQELAVAEEALEAAVVETEGEEVILSEKSLILQRLTSLSLEEDEDIEAVNVELPKTDCVDILVSAVNSLTEISAILLGPEYQGRLTILEAGMQAYYDSEETEEIESADVDCVYAAFYEEAWYRSKVTDIREDEVEIFFVDRGDNGRAQISDLRKLPPQFKKLPLQAIELTLANLPDSDIPEQIQVLSEMILGKELVASILDGPVELTIVELFDTSSAQDININEQLAIKLNLNEEQDFEQQLPKDGDQSDAFVSYVSESGIFCMIFNGPGLQKLDALLEELTQYFSKGAKAADLLRNPELEKVVCTRWKEDGALYRVMITCIMAEEKKAEIEFIDYGNRDIVPFHALREIPESIKELRTLPPQVVKCELINSPEEAKALWKYGLAAKIHSELKTQTVVVKVVFASRDTISFPLIDILVADSIDTSKFTSISEEIAEICVLMRDHNDTEATSSDDSVFLQNQEEDAISQSINIPLSVTRSSSGSSETSFHAERKLSADNKVLHSQVSRSSVASDGVLTTKGSVFLQDVEFPSLKIKECWNVVIVTCARSPSKFYFLLHENLNDLITVMEEMNRFYEDSDDYFDNCNKGDLCAIFVEEEDTWYRGVVTSRVEIEDEDRVGVFLVDNGETLFVPITEARSLPEQFHALPFQAMKASLSVAGTEEKWTKKSCKLFSELVLSKLCYARIESPLLYPASYSLASGETLELKLHDTHNDISEQLVSGNHVESR